jgi:hypothetical protein
MKHSADNEKPWSIQVDEMLEQERRAREAKHPPAPKTFFINIAALWRKWKAHKNK